MKNNIFILETDASDIGIGSCLKVTNECGEEFIVNYDSAKFSDTELRWNVVEKEAHAIITSIKKNRHYLLGKKFIIRTDSRILSYLHAKRKPKNRKLLNWALELSEYDYELVHIPSSLNGISDCLSRLDQVCLIQEIPPLFEVNELKTMQNNDTDIHNAIKYLRQQKKKFDIQTLGNLKRFRKKLKIDKNGVLTWNNKIVTPPNFRSKVLELSHDHPMSGHFQFDRTWLRVSTNYFWPGAKEDVNNWVKSCQKCNEFNTPAQGYTRRPLVPIETNSRFDFVCYDLAGPFMPKTDRGNVYALIIIDHFSKWPEIVPLPNAQAPVIAQAIYDHWVCRYGVMARLHSDGANNVDGEVMRQLSSLIGADKSKSSRLHPEGDGISEATIKQVKSIIRKHVDYYGQNWDLYLQSAAFAIRSSIHNGIGVTPAELVVGGKLKHPCEITTNKLPDNAPLNVKQARKFAEKLHNRINESSRIVRNTLQRSRNQMKKAYDKHVTSHNYLVGDHVMLWDPPHRTGVSRSFQPKWLGPWTIVELIGNTNCQLRNEKGVKKYVHLNQLKKIAKRNPLYNREVSSNEASNLKLPETVDPSIFEFSSDSYHAATPMEEDIQYVPRFPIDNAYVNLDESNILENRLRIRR